MPRPGRGGLRRKMLCQAKAGTPVHDATMAGRRPASPGGFRFTCFKPAEYAAQCVDIKCGLDGLLP